MVQVMSFAEEMGHDIPNEHDDRGSGGGYRSYHRRIPRIITCIDVKKIHETAKALLLEIKEKQYWLPKSQVTLNGTEVKIPEWLVESVEPVKQT
jgi:hypothetical protein